MRRSLSNEQYKRTVMMIIVPELFLLESQSLKVVYKAKRRLTIWNTHRYELPNRVVGITVVPFRRLIGGPTAGPGRVVYAGLQHSIPTREPNLDPRRETMCLLTGFSKVIQISEGRSLTEYVRQQLHDAEHWHGSEYTGSNSCHTDH